MEDMRPLDRRATRREALRDREGTAVANARALVTACPHGACDAAQAQYESVDRNADVSPAEWSARSGHAPGCPVLGRDPSTDVWRLLTALGIVRSPDLSRRPRRDGHVTFI